jgi:hypothetical protein
MRSVAGIAALSIEDNPRIHKVHADLGSPFLSVIDRKTHNLGGTRKRTDRILVPDASATQGQDAFVMNLC